MFRAFQSRAARRVAAASVVVGATGTALKDDTESSIARFGRSLYHAALVGLDYKYGAAAKLPPGSEEQLRAKSATHQRAADRLLGVCLLHGGLYIKLGQFVASMNHVLPSEYPTTLAACQDRANAVPFDDIRAVVERELGRPLDEAFLEFEASPIAAASLAQVHRAVAADGRAVACKVQYPKLPTQVAADMRTMRVLATLLSRAFPEHEYTWLLPEFEQSISEELDFRHEARNAAETSANFSDDPRIHVPLVLEELSSERVLTMEFIDGVKLTDAEGLSALGLDGCELAHIVSTAFSKMIFAHGLVHCDPHAGNLLARRLPGDDKGGAPSSRRRAQLVLLDHGMYRRLGEPFRRNYSALWTGLLTGDHASGREAALALGVPNDDYDALALVLTFRPAGSTLAIGARITKEERRKLRAKYGKLGASDVNAFLERLPRDMLFVMRTWSLVRSLNRALGGTTRQRLLVIAEHAAAGTITGGAFRAAWARLRMRLLVRVVDYMSVAMVVALSAWHRFTYTMTSGRLFGSSNGAGAEDAGAPDEAPHGTSAADPRLGARLTAPIAGKRSKDRLRELG